MRTKTVFFGVGALALAFVAAGCGAAPTHIAAAAGEALPSSAQVATAGTVAGGGGYDAVGTVEAHTSANLAARVPGTISAVRVGVGDRVHTGEVLVTLSTPEAPQAVAQAQAAVTAASAQLEAAQRQATAAEAQAMLAASTYKRYQQLRSKNAVSPHEFEQVAAANQSAGADRAAATAREHAAAAALAEAQAALAQAQTRAGFSTLTAPFNGVVTAKLAHPGDLATPGVPLLRLESNAGFDLAVSVPERLLGGLHVGQPVAVTLDSQSGTLSGRIREIAPASDPTTRAALVKVALPAAAGVRSGLYGHVTLPQTGGAGATMSVPDAALVRFGELDELYVLNQAGRAELRLVTTGAHAGGEVEILSGLNPGERYVTNPAVLATASAGGSGE